MNFLSRRSFLKRTPAAGLGAALAMRFEHPSKPSLVASPGDEAAAAGADAAPRDEDHAFFDRELASFVPEKVFDAHCHLWTRPAGAFQDRGLPEAAGWAEWRRLVDVLHPNRRTGALFIPFPSAGPDTCVEENVQANQWVGAHAAADPAFRGLFLIRPEDDPEWVRQEVRRLGLHGLKCYHLYAEKKPTWEADIPEYLPERLLKVADEEGWAITLHMVKSRAVADESNIHWIRHYCETYPNMKLILAHSARGFQPAHNLEGLPKLAGLENLYCDTSANCEPMAHQAILRILGHKRLLYGSDLPVSHLRGRSLGVADSFLWIYGHTPVWGEDYARIKPVLIGLEHLRSLKWACWSERLPDSAVEDIFWNNAARLFGVA